MTLVIPETDMYLSSTMILLIAKINRDFTNC